MNRPQLIDGLTSADSLLQNLRSLTNTLQRAADAGRTNPATDKKLAEMKSQFETDVARLLAALPGKSGSGEVVAPEDKEHPDIEKLAAYLQATFGTDGDENPVDVAIDRLSKLVLENGSLTETNRQLLAEVEKGKR